MKEAKFSALLLRLPAGSGAALAIDTRTFLGVSGVSFDIEPLFSTGPPSAEFGVAAAGEGWEWYVARPTAVTGRKAWDLAHDAVRKQVGLTGSPEVFIEPDFEQQWLPENPLLPSPAGVVAAAACVFDDQIPNLPRINGRFAWHLGDGYSQLKSARDGAANGKVVRIAHLDTGYDPNHSVLPPHLRRDLQRNFVNDQAANDAHDPGKHELLRNPGHGTGTLSILAGGHFKFNGAGYPNQFDDLIGGAPQAEIVPVRVGKSVVQLYTSTVAAGINYAAELCAKEATRVHVMSMSMGGVASQAWADAVNKAYEAGIVYVCAAGNNFSAGPFGVPTRFIVYPARFRRVIAACGVMANAHPYYGLSFGTMQGNWGPASKMATALAAFTPNIPWAELGCADIVDMNGQGTSAATPQVAAAAALYLQRHLTEIAKYPENWMRVEAVRRGLFASADKSADGGSSEKLGNGILKSARALAFAPPKASALQKTPPDRAIFPFLRALSGFGLVADPASRMLELEATQLAQRWPRTDVPNPFETVLPDPDSPPEAISGSQRLAYLEALHDHPLASDRLVRYVESLLPQTPRGPTRGKRTRVARKNPAVDQKLEPSMTPGPRAFTVATPPFRRLRGFSLDPSLAIDLKTVGISEITLQLPWENLEPGPRGEYLEVIDFDPGSDCFYEPVRLDDPKLLAQDGLAPSAGTPQFHQQMVYAVTSLTIHKFERALGRRSLWRPGPSPDPRKPKNDSNFVQRLRIYPHGLRERNAYYTPAKVALLFGYFRASADAPGEHMAGGMVFSCLSHDIIAHETTHALLDGMNRSFLSPTNPDVHAFHEAFADLVALFQHFTFPEILRHQISSTRGAVRSQENLLGQLAGEFGRGTGLRTALRDAIGRIENGTWKPHQPKPDEYENTFEPHRRGAILVAAVFDAFLSIYERRTADLLRLATGGTGVVQPDAIHPDLVNRLAVEAAKSADHVLMMCVRALDYCPPVDITFGEYLRAIITADFDLVPDDDLGYRTAFIEAFRKRALYPREVRTLSVESLLWRNLEQDGLTPSPQLEAALIQLRQYAQEHTYSESREALFHLERSMRWQIHEWMKAHFLSGPAGVSDAAYLGLDPKLTFEVRSARIAFRTSPDGGMNPQLLLGILQRRPRPADPDDPRGPKMVFEGGCSLIADLRSCRIRYCIRKGVNSQSRLERQQAFAETSHSTRRGVYFGSPRWNAELEEPFAALHRGL
ncbi:MAG: S8 family serine peptidase [Spartobacteria bacterium]